MKPWKYIEDQLTKLEKWKKLNQRKADEKITVFILKKKLLSASKTKVTTVEF